jgi:hypothetical protein
MEEPNAGFALGDTGVRAGDDVARVPGERWLPGTAATESNPSAETTRIDVTKTTKTAVARGMPRGSDAGTYFNMMGIRGPRPRTPAPAFSVAL